MEMNRENCLSALRTNPETAGCFAWSLPESVQGGSFWLEAVRANPWVLKFMPDELKTLELCREAIRRNGLMISHVPSELASKELCLEAIAQNVQAVLFAPAKLLTPALWLAAMRRSSICSPRRLSADGSWNMRPSTCRTA